MPKGHVICADNLDHMRGLPDGCCDLIYVDPPFDWNRTAGNDRRSGFVISDRHGGGLDGFLAFLRPRLTELHRLLSPRASLYVHLDPRTVHHVKVMLDGIFPADAFLNEIIWSYRTGGRTGKWFARKHDTILLYARNAGHHTFHPQRAGRYRTDGLRIDDDGRPYKSTSGGPLYFHPDGPVMADVWDIPFLSTVSKERTGYPTQKPEALLERIVCASSNEGDVVADFFCGSGTAAAVAQRPRTAVDRMRCKPGSGGDRTTTARSRPRGGVIHDVPAARRTTESTTPMAAGSLIRRYQPATPTGSRVDWWA